MFADFDYFLIQSAGLFGFFGALRDSAESRQRSPRPETGVSFWFLGVLGVFGFLSDFCSRCGVATTFSSSRGRYLFGLSGFSEFFWFL